METPRHFSCDLRPLVTAAFVAVDAVAVVVVAVVVVVVVVVVDCGIHCGQL